MALTRTESKQPTILIVDDTPVSLAMLEAVLETEGFHTLTASNAASALTTCVDRAPDLILLDVIMPDQSGYEVCAALKRDARTADIPVIFLSSMDDVTSKVAGFKHGGVDYISKPVHAEEVLARVRVHLRLRENNIRLLREQKERIEELRSAQQSLLVRPEDCPNARFAVSYHPLDAAGGDFYDVIPLDEAQFVYFVADVSGHGAGAAFLTSAIKALLRQYSTPLYSPEDSMRGVDAAVRHALRDEQFLTAAYARMNRRTRRLTLVSAGHPPLIVVGESGATQVVQTDSDPLGIFGSLTLQRREISVSRGDRLFLFTDGLIEDTPGGARDHGLERLLSACVDFRSLPLHQCVSRVVDRVRHGLACQGDDILLLGFEACDL